MQKQPDIQTVLRELHNITGFRLSVYDTNFKEIDAYPGEVSPYCRLVQSSEAGLCKCHENDRKAFERVQANPEVYLYRCCFGLYEAVAPLYVLGELAGYLMMGQAIDNPETSRKELVSNATSIIKDRAALEKAAADVHVFRSDTMESCIKIFDICAQYITLSNRFFKNGTDLPDRIKRHIDDNYSEPVTIDSICGLFFCSRTGAMASFKKKYGVSIVEHLTKVRIHAASRLLLNTQSPIGKIAAKCGYTDPNYFCKVFLKHCGLTPTEYRRKAVNTEPF